MFGIEIRNSLNNIIVDSSLSNFEVVFEIDFSVTTPHPYSGYYNFYTFPVSLPEIPLVFCLPILNSTIYGSFISETGILLYVNTPGTYKLKLMLPVSLNLGPNPSAKEWGIEVYTELGLHTWKSNSKLLNLSTILVRKSTSLSLSNLIYSSRGGNLWGSLNTLGLMYSNGSSPGVNESIQRTSENTLIFKRYAPFGITETSSYDGRPYTYYHFTAEEI